MEQTELRQLQNSVEIIGTLKSKTLEVKTSKAGKQYMSGDLVVLTEDNNRINEHKIKIFIMQTSKLFKGIETVQKEYKSIEKDGKENADRIRVTGELTLNEYYNGQGKLVQFNEIKGVFFNRLEDDTPDRAIASIEVVVESFDDKLDAEGLPVGIKTVKAFTVAWGNTVVEMLNTVVQDELAEAMMELYQPFSTGRLSFKLNNYVEKVETEEEPVNVQHGFGSTATIEPKVVNNYTNNIEIIGGDIPFMGSKEYTMEEIEEAQRLRKLALQTLAAPAPQNPATTGFGSNGVTPPADVNNEDPFINDADLPDF